nr:Uma2 family endonuclease [Syntrophomonas palmitatica]
MSAPKPGRKYTYGDYLKWPGEERWEIIDGVPYMMSPAPSSEHQRILLEIASQLHLYLRGKSCMVFPAPFDVRLPRGDEKDEDIQTVVQPDIVVICDNSKLDRRGYRGAPAMVVEILSPQTTKKDLREKYDLYERSGIKEYWVVFPLDQVLDVYLLDEEGKYQKNRTYEKDARVKPSIFEDLEIDLGLVFRDN